ncbi:hypothetical protein GCM10026982_38370 [Nocardiopsis aegyptia]
MWAHNWDIMGLRWRLFHSRRPVTPASPALGIAWRGTWSRECVTPRGRSPGTRQPGGRVDGFDLKFVHCGDEDAEG